MSEPTPGLDMAAVHWLTTMLHNVDVGLVVLDRACNVSLWNGFMENHSGMSSRQVMHQNLFGLFPDIPQKWLRRKLESVCLLRVTAFTVWEQRPYVFRFKNHRSITGTTECMYQNLSIVPLTDLAGEVSHVCLIVYDVTDAAVGRQALLDANVELARLSQTDALTGLWNRGHWEAAVEREFMRCRRTGSPASLVMLDIDHFKKVNDTHGHQAGDAVIRAVASMLADTARGTDVPGRYGGEEFGALLVSADAAGGGYFAERLRKNAEKLVVTHDGVDISFTVSLGVAELAADMVNHEAWIGGADAALYASKEGGRNRATIHGDLAA